MEEHTSASVYVPSSLVLQRLLGKSRASASATAKVTPAPVLTTSSGEAPSEKVSAAATPSAPVASPPIAPTYASVIRKSLPAAATTTTPTGTTSTPTQKPCTAKVTVSAAQGTPPMAAAGKPALSTNTAVSAPGSQPLTPHIMKHSEASRASGIPRMTLPQTVTAVSSASMSASTTHSDRTARTAQAGAPPQASVPTSAKSSPQRKPTETRAELAATSPPTVMITSSPPVAALPDSLVRHTPATTTTATTTTTTTTTAAAATLSASAPANTQSLLCDDDVSFVMATLTWHVDLLMLLLQHAPSPLRVTPRSPASAPKPAPATPSTVAVDTAAAATSSCQTSMSTTTTTTSVTPISGWIDLFQNASGASSTPAEVSRSRRVKEIFSSRGWGAPSRALPRLGEDSDRETDAHASPTTATAAASPSSPSRSWLDTALFPSLEEAQQYWLSAGGGRRRNRTFFAPTPMTPRSPVKTTNASSDAKTPDNMPGFGSDNNSSRSRRTPTGRTTPTSLATPRGSGSGGATGGGSGGAVLRKAGLTTSVSSGGTPSSAINVSRLITHTAARAGMATPRTPHNTSGSHALTPITPHTHTTLSATASASFPAACAGHAGEERAPCLPTLSRPLSTESLASLVSFTAPGTAASSRMSSALLLPINTRDDDDDGGEKNVALRSGAPVTPTLTAPSGMTPHYHKSKRRAGPGRRCPKRVLKRYIANFVPISARAHFVYGSDVPSKINIDKDNDEDDDDEDGEGDGEAVAAVVGDVVVADVDKAEPSSSSSKRAEVARAPRTNAWGKGEAGHCLFPRAGAVPVEITQPHTAIPDSEHETMHSDNQPATSSVLQVDMPPRAASLDTLSSSLVHPFIRPSWLYGGRPQHGWDLSGGLTAGALPSASRHDRAHVLAQLLVSNVSLNSMCSETDTEEEDETRAEQEAFAAVDSEEDVVASSLAWSARRRHRHASGGGGRSSAGPQSSGGGGGGGTSPAVVARHSRTNTSHAEAAEILTVSATASTTSHHTDASAGDGGGGGAGGDALSTPNVGQRIDVPLEELGADAARALLQRTFSPPSGAPGAAVVDPLPAMQPHRHRNSSTRTQTRTGPHAELVDSQSATHHGRRHKRFFYSAQPLLDKQKERRKTERMRRRREGRERGSGSDTSSNVSSGSSTDRSRSSRSTGSDSGDDMTDGSRSGTSTPGVRLDAGSFCSSSNSEGSPHGTPTRAARRQRHGRGRAAGHAHPQTSSSSATGSSGTPYSRTTSGYTPPLLPQSALSDSSTTQLPTPRQALPPVGLIATTTAASSSTSVVPTVTQGSVQHHHHNNIGQGQGQGQPHSTQQPTTAHGVATTTHPAAATATTAARGPQVKVLAYIKPKPSRATRVDSANTGANLTPAKTLGAPSQSPQQMPQQPPPPPAPKLPEHYAIGFFLQKFLRAVLVVLIAQVRWQQPQTTLPIVCGRLATADTTPPDAESCEAAKEHPLMAALRQDTRLASSAPISSSLGHVAAMEGGKKDADASPFRLNTIEYKALCFVRAHLPAFRSMVSKFVMRGANEVMRRSMQPLLGHRVVAETLAELETASTSRDATSEEREGSTTTTASNATTTTTHSHSSTARPSPAKASESVAERSTEDQTNPTAPSLSPAVLADPTRSADTLQQLAAVHDTLSTGAVGTLYTAAAAATCYRHRLSGTLSELVEDVEPLNTSELYLSGKDAAWQPLLLEVQNVTRVLQCYAEAVHPFAKLQSSPAGAMDKPGVAPQAATTTTTTTATKPHHHLLLAALKRFVMGTEQRVLAPTAATTSVSTPPTAHSTATNSAATSTTLTHPDAVTQALLKTDEVVESHSFLAYLQPFLESPDESLGTTHAANSMVAADAHVAGGAERRGKAQASGLRHQGGLPHSQSLPVLPSSTSSQETAATTTGATRVSSLSSGPRLNALPIPGILDPLTWHAYTYFPDAYPQAVDQQQQQQQQQPFSQQNGSNGSGGDHYMMLYVAVLPISGRLIYKWEIPAEDTDRFNLSVFFQSSLFSFLQGGAIPPPTCADGAHFVQDQARRMCALTDVAAITSTSPCAPTQDAIRAAVLSARFGSVGPSSAMLRETVYGLMADAGVAGGEGPLASRLTSCSALVHCSAGMHRSCGMALAFLLWLLFQVGKMVEFKQLREGRRASAHHGSSNNNNPPVANGPHVASTAETATTTAATTTATGTAAPAPSSRTLEVCMAHVKRCRPIAEPIPTVQFLLEHFARELQLDAVA